MLQKWAERQENLSLQRASSQAQVQARVYLELFTVKSGPTRPPSPISSSNLHSANSQQSLQVRLLPIEPDLFIL